MANEFIARNGIISKNNTVISGSLTLSKGLGSLSINQILGAFPLSGSSIVIGINSLSTDSTGISNIAIGESTLQKNTTGIENVAIGIVALQNNRTGNGNIAVGSFALKANVDGGYNTAIANSLQVLVTGSYNTAVGTGAGVSLTSGSYNTLIGYGADTDASYCTVIGNFKASVDNNQVVIADGQGYVALDSRGISGAGPYQTVIHGRFVGLGQSGANIFNNDGSGQIAGDNINWDTGGNFNAYTLNAGGNTLSSDGSGTLSYGDFSWSNGTFYFPQVSIGSDGQINNGSGFIAYGNGTGQLTDGLTWDTNGDLTLSSLITNGAYNSYIDTQGIYQGGASVAFGSQIDSYSSQSPDSIIYISINGVAYALLAFNATQ
jgi:hypothetical protein